MFMVHPKGIVMAPGVAIGPNGPIFQKGSAGAVAG